MKKKFWICNELSTTEGEMLVYGYIGQYEEIDDAAFVTDFRKLESKYSTIIIRINCGGGDVYKGMTIFNCIKNSKARVDIKIDGIAASMGAVLCAGATGTVEMSKYARYMTHRVSAWMGGNADEMRAMAEELEKLETNIASIIAKRTGLTTEEARTKYITNKDRWIGAEQALTEKLIDGIYDADPVQLPENADDEKVFNAYQHQFNNRLQKPNDMKQIALLLGLPENATEAQIEAAVKQMKENLTNAENAAKAVVKAQAKALVDNSIKEGRLTEADRATFENLAETNMEAAQTAINKIPTAKKPLQAINNTTVTVPGAVVNSTDEITTWEQLTEKGDEFVAQFKVDNAEVYAKLLKEYTAKPVK